MGQTADQLRQEIEQKREDAASKFEQIESRVQELPQMAMDSVTETVEKATTAVTDTVQQTKEAVSETVQQVKQSVENIDLRRQIEERPLAVLGAALAGGFLLGGILGGGGNKQGGGQYSESQQGGKASGLRGAAKDSGLEEMLGGFTAAVMGMATERIRSAVEQGFPQIAERMQQSSQSSPPRSTSGGDGQGREGMIGAGSGSGTAGDGASGDGKPAAAQTDASGRMAPYFTAGAEERSGVSG